eukprot:15365961-Ditylum_brightwellii.AAC.1
MEARKNLTWTQQNEPPPVYPASKIAVYVNNGMITRNMNREIQQAYTAIALREYMNQQFNWNRSTANIVD